MNERERDIESYLKRKIEALGGLFLKWVSPGNDGVPDRIAILPGGRIYFVELKTDRGKPKGVQKYMIRKLRERGARVDIVYGRIDADQWLEAVMNDEI